MLELKKRPVQRRKLSDAVFDQLVALIREDGYRPGDQLPAERELMDSFGVGRPVVREAMQRLAGMGMITIQHGERARVGQVDLDSVFNQIDLPARHLLSSSARNVDHLREARIFIEAGLVRLAAARASAEDIARLAAALDEMRRAQSSDDFVAADMGFHVEIARISGNPIFVAGSRAILQWMSDYGRDMLRAKGQQQTLDEHEQILKCIVAHDPAAAEQAIRQHLDRTARSPARSGGAARRAQRNEGSNPNEKERFA